MYGWSVTRSAIQAIKPAPHPCNQSLPRDPITLMVSFQSDLLHSLRRSVTHAAMTDHKAHHSSMLLPVMRQSSKGRGSKGNINGGGNGGGRGGGEEGEGVGG